MFGVNICLTIHTVVKSEYRIKECNGDIQSIVTLTNNITDVLQNIRKVKLLLSIRT